MRIREMTHNECTATVATQRLERLACADNNSPYVVPICYAYSANRPFAFSMPGKKLKILHANPKACMLIDALETRHRWKSVIVDALFHELFRYRTPARRAPEGLSAPRKGRRLAGTRRIQASAATSGYHLAPYIL